MNMYKILRYAIIGARHERDFYAQQATMEQDVDKVHASLHGRLAKKCDEDGAILVDMFREKSELWNSLEVR